jgi:Ca2+-binding EF-hand superfamily protein
METKKPRSEAQKKADKIYKTKIKGTYKVIGFSLPTKEAEKIEKIIEKTGMTKVDFLRKAVKNYENF